MLEAGGDLVLTPPTSTPSRDRQTHLPLDVCKQRAGPYPEELRRQPLVPQFLLHQRQPRKGLLCSADASGRLKAYLSGRREE